MKRASGKLKPQMRLVDGGVVTSLPLADRKFKAFNRAGRLVLAAFGVLTVHVLKTVASLEARYAIARGWL